jgi:hypothetical protein
MMNEKIKLDLCHRALLNFPCHSNIVALQNIVCYLVHHTKILI